MEDPWRTYIPHDEFGDLYVGLVVDGIESKEKNRNLVEIVKLLFLRRLDRNIITVRNLV
jgi:hypothetical protein